MKNQIAIIGLGVMGKSLALNLVRHGFRVAGYNRTYSVTESLAGTENLTGYKTLEETLASLESPRKIFLMVPAGKAVDMVIDQLKPLLVDGDIVMDGGNSFFMDDKRRAMDLKELGVKYIAVGVSGGEKGALYGPSIMPSGDKDAYEQVSMFLETIAAKKDGVPCCTYIGPEGSGHYVKMVHNGIEYADMQLICEVYIYLKAANYTNEQIADVFESWNSGKMESYLLGITIRVLREKDPDTNKDLLDLIVDEAGNKGTGKWTSEVSLQQDMNTSLIYGAYMARVTSNNTSLRHLLKPVTPQVEVDIDVLKHAYYVARVVAYEQGFRLYSDASELYGWNLNLEEIATIFRAGCIIQATLLEDIRAHYHTSFDSLIRGFKEVQEYLQDLKRIAANAILNDVPCPLFIAAISYLQPMQGQLLGANMIQAQRDFFGAHTFKRIDKEGSFHHIWEKLS